MGVEDEAEMDMYKKSSCMKYPASHPTFQTSPLGRSPEIIIMTSRDLLLGDPGPQVPMTRPKRGGLWCCVGLWLGGIVTAIFVGFGLMALIVYLVVHPQLPRYKVQSVNLLHLPTQTLSATDPDPNTVLSFLIASRNPNSKAGIIYENSAVTVKADGMTITTTTIPNFYQTHKNTTVLVADFSLKRWVTNLLVDKGRGLSNWAISVNLDVTARLKVGLLKAKQFNINVRCTLIVDVLSSPQNIKQGRCKVYT